MINAIIRHGEKTLVVTFPLSPLELNKELLSIGIRDMQLPLNMDEDENGVSLNLYAESDIGNHLIHVFGKTDTLATVNLACDMIAHLNEEQQGELESYIIHDQYRSTNELFDDLKEYLSRPTQTVNFYCPLVVHTESDDYRPGDDIELVEIDNSILNNYEEQIREALVEEMARGKGEDMATYYDGLAKDKLVSARWDIKIINEEMYGLIKVKITEPFTDEEKADIAEWITGQNSDGLLENFGEEPFDTEDGTLYIDFWNPGDDYFVLEEADFNNYVSGGMKAQDIQM